MASVKISELPVAGTLDGTEEIPLVQAGTTKGALLSALYAILARAGLATAAGLTMNTGKLLGRSTAGTGALEELTVGTGLSLTGGTLSVSGGTPAMTSINNQQYFQGL